MALFNTQFSDGKLLLKNIILSVLLANIRCSATENGSVAKSKCYNYLGIEHFP